MTGVETALAVAAIAGTAVSAAGAMSAAQSRKKQAEFQAEVAEQQATRERQVAESESREFLDRQRRLMSAARTGRAASGVAMGEGSPLLVEEDTIQEIAFQTEKIRRGGEVRATRLEQEAMLQGAKGRAAGRAGFFRAGSTLLTGASEFG